MGIIITESDKKRILSLIKESIDTTELTNYANEYIDGHNCDEIYNDLLRFQSAANNGEVTLSQSDKETLSDSINKVKSYKGFACGTIKSKMKSEFNKQANSDPQKLLDSMCWFSKNVYIKTLRVCQAQSITPTPQISNVPKVNIPSVTIPDEIPMTKPNVSLGRIFKVEDSSPKLEDVKRYVSSKVNSSLKIKNNPPLKITCDGIVISYDDTSNQYSISVDMEICEEKDRSWFFAMVGNVGNEINKSLIIDFKGRFKSEGSSEVIECQKTVVVKDKQWNEIILIGDRPPNSKLLEQRNIYK
jgi:hypothetical protein